MSFEDVMGNLSKWRTATEALAALGAQLELDESGTQAPPEIAAALRAVLVAAGIGDLDDLAPQQRASALALVRLTVRSAADLLAEPARAPGWSYTDSVILDGWGRASMMVPTIIAGSHPDLGDVEAFLDVGTGVGLLAVAATNVWPRSSVVGIDRWDTSLDHARAHVDQFKLSERITLREQDLVDVDDVDAYDCIWVPTFFMSEDALAKSLPGLVRATRPGGWIALGRFQPPPDPLAEATNTLQTIRDGGHHLDAKRAIELLEDARCISVHAAARTMPVPLELILGQKPR
jgi:hypothetical protein